MIIAFIAGTCAVKMVSVALAGRFAGFRGLELINLGITTNARGGPGIVLASVAFDAGIISSRFYSTLVHPRTQHCVGLHANQSTNSFGAGPMQSAHPNGTPGRNHQRRGGSRPLALPSAPTEPKQAIPPRVARARPQIAHRSATDRRCEKFLYCYFKTPSRGCGGVAFNVIAICTLRVERPGG